MKVAQAASPPDSALVIFSERFRDHRPPPGHPERVERADVMSVVAEHARLLGFQVEEPLPATPVQLKQVHTPKYVDSLTALAGKAVQLDPDTYTSTHSYEVACLAAGAAAQAAEQVVTTTTRRALVLARPPGHHAESERAMGFCLFNNVALAAARARELGRSRIAIVDYDVHHGNGTQEIFYDDPQILYISTHQYPYYPGTGAASEVGEGKGRGFTVNLPMEAGATDGDYVSVFEGIVIPVLVAFRPELILVSAGFDAHARDPLGGMRMSSHGFCHLSATLCDVADRFCDGRIAFVTEGGYHLPTLGECLRGVTEVLRGSSKCGEISTAATHRARETIAATKQAQREFWPGL